MTRPVGTRDLPWVVPTLSGYLALGSVLAGKWFSNKHEDVLRSLRTCGPF